MTNEELGPKPDPIIEEPQLQPGGTDALPDNDTNLTRDLDPEKNPAVDEESPDELSEGEDKQQEPEGEDAEDSEAGSRAEDTPV